MMRVIVRFYDKSGVMDQMVNMKTISPTMPEHEVRKTFDDILEMIDTKFRDMQFA